MMFDGGKVRALWWSACVCVVKGAWMVSCVRIDQHDLLNVVTLSWEREANRGSV